VALTDVLLLSTG